MNRTLLLALLFLLSPLALPQDRPVAAGAWFSDARIDGLVRGATPVPAPPEAAGTVGKGVRLDREVPLEYPALARESGYISFWVRPDWNGDDGETHRLLRIGEPGIHGLLVEKSARGMLRFVMATPRKVTAARADVTAWRAGEWHHVVCAWLSRDGRPIGLPLWIDRVAVAGPIAGGDCFPDPAELPDRRLYLGHETSRATLDELVLRPDLRTELSPSLIALVYRDWFRTGPVERIEIDPEPLRVPADRRVVAGHPKQFGLRAGAGPLAPVTDFAVRYGQWSDYDAKPFIRWRTTDADVAVVNENGRVTGGKPGTCELVAEYRGKEARYPLRVVPADLPDLTVVCVSLLPRYEEGAKKDRHAPGDRVRAVVRIDNFGYQTVPANTPVWLEMIPDADRDFVLEEGTRPSEMKSLRIPGELKPRESVEVGFTIDWPEEPTWLRVTVDPADRVSEICEANNVRTVLSTARPMQFGYQPSRLEAWYGSGRMNHVGSFCHLDWIQAQVDRVNGMLRDAAYDTTSPIGVGDAIRTDAVYPFESGAERDERNRQHGKFYDGGFPVGERIDAMAVDAAILHEFGHTCLALPDLYGYPVAANRVLLEDDQGKLYAGTDVLPAVRYDLLPLPAILRTPCHAGSSPLMDGCQLWIHPAHAGLVHHFAGKRGPRFWGTQGSLVPRKEQALAILDVDDRPLAGAAVSVYHVAHVEGSWAHTKYFAERPKFRGVTDEAGRYVFPKRTDPLWDDPATDEFEGSIPVWNPFGVAPAPDGKPHETAFTPNVIRVEGLLLVKIRTEAETEFAWLTLLDMNAAYFRGDTETAEFQIRSSLRPGGKAVVPRERKLPAKLRIKNLRPEAVAPKEIRVRCGESFTIDGSKSRDPEGQPLLYRWHVAGGGIHSRGPDGAVFRATAPDVATDGAVEFHVIDGLRASRTERVAIRVRPPKERIVLAFGGEGRAQWRYTTEPPRDGWEQPRFDDGRWKRGEAGFGRPGPPWLKVGTAWTKPAIWLRRRFTLPEEEEWGRLQIVLHHDEDVSIYLNGVLAVERQGFREGYTSVPIGRRARAALRPGKNLIAVHCTNRVGWQYVDVGIYR